MLPFVLVFVTVILLVLSQQTLVPRMPFPATVGASAPGATSAGAILPDLIHAAVRLGPDGGPRSSREARGRGRDPLRDHRAVVGRETRTPWYIRVRALMLLILIVIGVALAFAGITLLLIASGRFLLEILAG